MMGAVICGTWLHLKCTNEANVKLQSLCLKDNELLTVFKLADNVSAYSTLALYDLDRQSSVLHTYCAVILHNRADTWRLHTFMPTSPTCRPTDHEAGVLTGPPL